MRFQAILRVLVIMAVMAVGVSAGTAGTATDDAKVGVRQIEAFNREFRRVTVAMDNAATMALWEEDGVTLLPGMAPIQGKATIAKWLDGVTAKMPGYKVLQQKNDFHDINVSGDWASEWATTAQTVQPPGGKPSFTAHGKILLVLHRANDGKWRIKEEMWNGAK